MQYRIQVHHFPNRTLYEPQYKILLFWQTLCPTPDVGIPLVDGYDTEEEAWERIEQDKKERVDEYIYERKR